MTDLFAPFSELCQQRHSVRTFQDKPVPATVIAKIQTIAKTSPYASGRKNWRMVIVEDQDLIQRLAALTDAAATAIAGTLREDFTPVFQNYAHSFSSFAGAPLLLIPVFKAFATLSYMQQTVNEEILQWERDNYVKSIACVSMLVLLAAESLGLGACLMTGPLLAEEEIKQALSLRPAQHIGALIPVGYPLS